MGKFELANKGTIFLDKVADLSPHAQAALLRVIQQKEITRLGGQKIIPVDVRIICASNRNLEQVITRQALVEETPILTGKSFMLSTESSYSKEVVTDNFQLVQQVLVDAGLIKQKLLQH